MMSVRALERSNAPGRVVQKPRLLKGRDARHRGGNNQRQNSYERVWRAMNAMPDEVAMLPPPTPTNDAYDWLVRRAQSPLCEAFSLEERLHFPGELPNEVLERAGELGLTPAQVCAALECWRAKMLEAVNEAAARLHARAGVAALTSSVEHGWPGMLDAFPQPPTFVE